MKKLQFLNILHHIEEYEYFKYIEQKNSYVVLISEIGRFIFHFLKSFLNLKGIFNFLRIKNKTVFYIGTKNQFNSINNVHSLISDSVIISTRFDSKQLKNHKDILYLNNTISYFFAILTLPWFLYFYMIATNVERFKFRYFFYEHLMSLGAFIYWRIALFFFTPKQVVICNELKGEYRAFVLNANKNNIKTYYIAHGVTVHLNKKLEPICDVYLLSGYYEFEHYKVENEETKFYFVGRPYYDSLKIKRPTTNITRIAICTNSLTLQSKLDELVKGLVNIDRFQIVYRPHPGHSESIASAYCTFHNIEYSNSNLIPSYVFLNNIDLIISGESSIVIEAIYSGTYSIIYPFGSDFSDAQDFVKNGVTTYCETISEILEFIDEKFIFANFENIKLYNYNQFSPSTSSSAIYELLKT